MWAYSQIETIYFTSFFFLTVFKSNVYFTMLKDNTSATKKNIPGNKNIACLLMPNGYAFKHYLQEIWKLLQ